MSARNECPECHCSNVENVNAFLFAPGADFFLCAECRHLWHVLKGQDGPAMHDLLGQVEEALVAAQ
jgi:hypothetical protein